MRVRRALFSLTDKQGAPGFARALAERGVEILSTGNTARLLREAGVAVQEVAEFTGFPEILDGRVKTLHPRVHAGLLARRDLAAHREQLAEHGLTTIDLLAVNLYPFEQVAARPAVDLAEALENIDIGGPSMIRSAAKNHEHVAVLVDPADYAAVEAELLGHDLELSLPTLRRLARKAFARTAAYDAAISAFLARHAEFGAADAPATPVPALGAGRALRYGENPHQHAAWHPFAASAVPAPLAARQLHGKELSFNNLVDADAALGLVLEFDEPGCVIVKHTNPCGAAVAAEPVSAFGAAYGGDPLAAFGGILAVNRPVDRALAEAIARPEHFFEVVVAPDFADGAVETLAHGAKWGRNVRLLAAHGAPPEAADVRVVRGGLLVQERDRRGRDDEFRVVTRRAPSAAEERDLRLAWLIAKHLKSNAIALVKGRALVGAGAGQMSRVDAVRIAVDKAGSRAAGAVLASDAFFPFRDGVDAAARAGVAALAQPGGSVRDAEVIAAADDQGLAMVFTGVRHFRH